MRLPSNFPSFTETATSLETSGNPKFVHLDSSDWIVLLSGEPQLAQSRPVKPAILTWTVLAAVIASLMLFTAGYDFTFPGPTTPTTYSMEIAQVIMFLLGYGIFGSSPLPPFMLSAVYMMIAIGLVLKKRWAWILTILMSLISLSLNVTQDVVLWPDAGGIGWYSLVITIAILFYLTRPKVRRYFQA